MTEVKTIAPILIAYYSTHGSTQLLAEMIAQGVESQGVEAMLRQVPRVSVMPEMAHLTKENSRD